MYDTVKYSLDLDGEIVGLEARSGNVVSIVPLDHANRHYAEIMRQVEAGELVIQPADTPE
jgi:hypothetical protein